MRELKSLDAALYETDCIVCGDQLNWEMISDSPIWSALCCNREYIMTVERVTVEDIEVGNQQGLRK